MGLQPNVDPDEDVLLQATLSLNHDKILFRGVNQDVDVEELTQYDISEIEQYYLRTGMYLSESFKISVSTKLHRFMRHVWKHIRLFRYARRGDTDSNDILHKAKKAAYLGINRRPTTISKKILIVMSTPNHHMINVDMRMNSHNVLSRFAATLVKRIRSINNRYTPKKRNKQQRVCWNYYTKHWTKFMYTKHNQLLSALCTTL